MLKSLIKIHNNKKQKIVVIKKRNYRKNNIKRYYWTLQFKNNFYSIFFYVESWHKKKTSDEN